MLVAAAPPGGGKPGGGCTVETLKVIEECEWAMFTVAGTCMVEVGLHEEIWLHPHTVWGWRQNLQALTPDTFSSFCNKDDCTIPPVTWMVGGSTTIIVAKSWILLIHSGRLMSVRSMGISMCLTDVPGGGGRIVRREHALMMCSSPLINSFSTGFKAKWKVEAYFFAS